jgi:hypothetical protein
MSLNAFRSGSRPPMAGNSERVEDSGFRASAQRLAGLKIGLRAGGRLLVPVPVLLRDQTRILKGEQDQ